MANAGEKKVRILLAISVALVAIIFALFFFEFPDNTHAKFIFSESEPCIGKRGRNYASAGASSVVSPSLSQIALIA